MKAARYIDANEQEKIVEELENMCINAPEHILDKLSKLKNLPVADVRENVHSEWIWQGEYEPTCYCRKCGVRQVYESHFCPNCGADMREVGSE